VGWDGALEIAVGEERATLAVYAGKLRLEEGGGHPRVPLTQFQLLALALGLASFEEISAGLPDAPLRNADRALLGALFPRRLVYSGYWG
jgi:hypothetical protein